MPLSVAFEDPIVSRRSVSLCGSSRMARPRRRRRKPVTEVWWTYERAQLQLRTEWDCQINAHGVRRVIERVEREVRQDLEERLLRRLGALAALCAPTLTLTGRVEDCFQLSSVSVQTEVNGVARTQSPQRLLHDTVGRLGEIRQDAQRERKNVPHKLALGRNAIVGRRLRRRDA